MKMPFSYKKHFFGSVLGVSILGHGVILMAGGLTSHSLHYSVQQAPSSLSVTFVEPDQKVLRKVENKQKILSTSRIKKNLVDESLHTENEVQESYTQNQRLAELPLKQGVRFEEKPNTIFNPPPIYPRLARQKGWEGTVVLLVKIERDGRPSRVQVKTSSGYPILDEAALKATMSWIFQPVSPKNALLISSTEIPIRFVIED